MEPLDNRRVNCPCTRLVEVQGDLKMADQKIDMETSALRKELHAITADFKELNLAAKECFESIQVSSLKFSDGAHKIGSLERDIRDLKAAVEMDKLRAKEHSLEKIAARTSEEKSYRAEIAKKLTLYERVGAAVLVLILALHGAEAGALLLRVLL